MIPRKQAYKQIALSVLVISGGAWLAWLSYSSFWNSRAYDNRYEIVAVIQTGPEKEALKTQYLAELLELSVEKKTNLYRFNLRDGEQKLLKNPLIKEVSLRRIPPGTLYVDYTIRKPYARIKDVTNTVIDKEGYLFPCTPFFSPKKLPEISLGINEQYLLQWGNQLRGEELELAYAILDKVAKEDVNYSITQIDLSRIHALSLGRRYVIVDVEETIENNKKKRVTLLLNRDHCLESLKEYFALQKTMKNKGLTLLSPILDLRLPRLAFISKEFKE